MRKKAPVGTAVAEGCTLSGLWRDRKRHIETVVKRRNGRPTLTRSVNGFTSRRDQGEIETVAKSAVTRSLTADQTCKLFADIASSALRIARDAEARAAAGVDGLDLVSTRRAAEAVLEVEETAARDA